MNEQLKITLWIALGGSLGTICRFAAGHALDQPAASTFIVNTLGSFLLAAIAGWAATRTIHNQYIPYGLGTGFCGAFTTMSTLAADTTALHNHASPRASALYLAASLAAGLLMTFAGFQAGKKLANQRPHQTTNPPETPCS